MVNNDNLSLTTVFAVCVDFRAAVDGLEAVAGLSAARPGAVFGRIPLLDGANLAFSSCTLIVTPLLKFMSCMLKVTPLLAFEGSGCVDQA